MAWIEHHPVGPAANPRQARHGEGSQWGPRAAGPGWRTGEGHLPLEHPFTHGHKAGVLERKAHAPAVPVEAHQTQLGGVEFDAALELDHQARHTALGHSHTNFANHPFAGNLAGTLGTAREINPNAIAIAAIAVFEKRVEIEVGRGAQQQLTLGRDRPSRQAAESASRQHGDELSRQHTRHQAGSPTARLKHWRPQNRAGRR